VKPRHIPMRTCTGCRQERPKREMVRVVRTPEGKVLVDRTGRQNGRGAYMCPRYDCWSQALRRGSLAHTLKVELSAEDRAELERLVDSYPREAVATPS